MKPLQWLWAIDMINYCSFSQFTCTHLTDLTSVNKFSLTSLSIDFHLYPSLIVASQVGLTFKCEPEPVWHWKIINGTWYLKGIIKYSLSSPSSFGSTDLDLLCLTFLLSSSFFCFWKTPPFLLKWYIHFQGKHA